MNWLVYDYYLYAAAALLGTFLAAGGLVWLLGSPRWAAQVASVAGVVPPFINVLGVLFGLTLAFLANDTWNAHDRALAAVNREADSLRAIAVFAGHLPADDAAWVRGAVDAYARAALAEWPLLSQRESSLDASARADGLLALLSEPRMLAASGPAIGSREIALAIAVRDGRETRLALSQTHVNPLKWVGMAVLGFLTMISVAVVHIGAPRAMRVAVALFALASAPTAVIVLIHGNPFQPPAAVSPKPLLAVLGDRR
ncbi:MAG: DUF4239 domain-containing protein [Proteobacteria bacterium]|nr:DUF4239 domain-containing protein [Pseudomonadota bacterium]